ncbi:cysteine desulfurase family protein [Floccifex sp.]|uniref:cysteine desulfurase family protein n=1 Tax=Floccifex sp. TaxID=2815810 RepID=UPI003EFC95DE
MIYFDHSSTTSVRPEVRRVYSQLLETQYGNADSLHSMGRSVHQLLEKSRENIASMLHVLPTEIIFTGCASESNSLAIIGYALKNKSRGNHILVSNVEHPSVQNAMAFLKNFGFEIEYLPINSSGIVTADLVQSKLRKDTILVSTMHVNNEMGAINPVEEISQVVHQHPTCVYHVDCVQSFSKIDVPFSCIDLATISAHKIHGLKGSALLVKKKNIQLMPLVQGGQQEQGIRGGTENAPANIVLSKTIRLALEEQKEVYQRVSKINEFIRMELNKIKEAHINSPEEALPYILNISFDQITSEVLLNALDQKGICVSAKSTCSSHQRNYSSTLVAMGYSEKIATHMIRLSFGKDNTMQEARIFIDACKEIIKDYGLSL